MDNPKFREIVIEELINHLGVSRESAEIIDTVFEALGSFEQSQKVIRLIFKKAGKNHVKFMLTVMAKDKNMTPEQYEKEVLNRITN